jgi:uncharacterized protein
MAIYFLDSSAVVKRYVHEIGSERVASILDPSAGNHAWIAGLAGPEVVAALARRAHLGGLPSADAAAAIDRFRREFGAVFGVVDVTAQIVTRAMHLAERRFLRGADAIQLAAVLRVHELSAAHGESCTLVSADTELNQAAAEEGIAVEDPAALP